MGSLASQSVAVAGMTSQGESLLPELNESEYLREVLRLGGDKSEKAVDDELVAKASALGISISRPSTSDKRNTSSAESASTVVTYHARTFSSASNGSASTALTSHSSVFHGPTTNSPVVTTVSRRRSKSLSFSHYEKYLTQIDPHINQPKFLKEPPPETIDTSGQSLFSVSTKRSFFSIKRGIKSRMRWRKKSSPAVDAPV
jgi:hypothetical protein